MTTEIRVLDSEDDLIAAANVFRAAMVGFPRLTNTAPGQITRLLEPGRTIGAMIAPYAFSAASSAAANGTA